MPDAGGRFGSHGFEFSREEVVTHVDAVQLARSIKASYVHPCWERYDHPSDLLTPEWIARVRQAGLGIILWHEERPSEIAALRQLGVDGICSDAPELLLTN